MACSIKPCLGVVMREEFRLGLFGIWKSFCQHLSNLLVILLPLALQERLIGRVLNEGMLEEVACLWPKPALIEQLGFN